MSRTVSWFSCGAASAVATKLTNPDVIAYCDTGAEHEDNQRFMLDCDAWFGKAVTKLKSEKFVDTWDVWETRKYIAGIRGAPCTGALKVDPRIAFQRDDDIHIFGYTADGPDMKRAESLREFWPDLNIETPLIDRGINKAGCLALVQQAGIEPPITYSWGLPHANCLPCPKATSAAYWALIRKRAPNEFDRMVELSRRLGARLARVDGERVFIDEVPADQAVTEPLMPDCDFLCSIAEQDFGPRKD
jgi:hypothetical protein